MAGKIASPDIIGSLTGLLQQLRPSPKALDHKGVPSAKHKALGQRAAERNAKDVAAHLSGRSERLAAITIGPGAAAAGAAV